MRKYLCTSIILICFFSCKCPQLLSPTILVNSKKPDVGSTLILTTHQQKHVNVFWTGPTGSFEGNSWIIENVNKQMSGNYTMQYVYKKRKKCKSVVVTEQINVRECPKFPSPKIYTNSDEVNVDTKLILAVPNIENTSIIWSAPDTTYFGNAWIRENVKKTMNGTYTAKYVDNTIKGCESEITPKKIIVVSRISEVKYNNSTYYLDYVSTQTSTTVWFRANKYTDDPINDIKVIEVNIKQETPAKAKEIICESVDYYGDRKFLLGCMKTAGAAGCALGAVATDGAGALIPVCEVLLTTAIPSLVDCISGIVEKVGEGVAGEAPVTAASAAVAISKKDMEDIIVSAAKMACITAKGGKPALINGKVQNIAPPPASPTNGNNGNGRTGEGKEHSGWQGGGNKGGGNNGGGNSGGGNNGGGNKGGGNRKEGGWGGGSTVGRQTSYYSVIPADSNDVETIDTTLKRPIGLVNLEPKWVIPDAPTAIKIAEIVLFNKFGKKNVVAQRPYNVTFLNDYWIIRGAEKNTSSKPFLIILNAKTGEVITITD